MAKQTFDKFVIDAVITYGQSHFDRNWAHVGVRIGPSCGNTWFEVGTTRIYQHFFFRRRFVEYERECIRMLNELASRSMISILYECVPLRTLVRRYVHPFNCWCHSRYYRMRPFGRKQYSYLDRRKPMEPIQPSNMFDFELILSPNESTMQNELLAFINAFVAGMNNVVDAVERPRRSLRNLCLRTIDRFDLRERYDEYATHLLQLVDKQ